MLICSINCNIFAELNNTEHHGNIFSNIREAVQYHCDINNCIYLFSFLM